MNHPTDHTIMDTSAKSPLELAADFKRELMDAARQRVALRRHFPGTFYRWARVADTGPGSDLLMVLRCREGGELVTEVKPMAWLEELAAGVSNEDVFKELMTQGDPFEFEDETPFD